MYYNQEYMRSLAPLIRMPKEALEALLTHFDDLKPEEAERTARYWADTTFSREDKIPSIEKIAARENGELLCILIYMAAAGYAHEKYKEIGIPDSVFYDTFNCLAEKMETCRHFTGRWGYTSVTWPARHAGLALFRIGRLSYALERAEKPIEENGIELVKAGKPYIYVHISDNEKLLGCAESIRDARAFFSEFFPVYKDAVFYSYTWLLDTRLQEILPSSSNILAFQKLFNIVGVRDDEEEVLTRIFGRYTENLETYTPSTSLGKGVLEYMKRGKRLGNGIGYTRF